jgi:hypothetical protein
MTAPTMRASRHLYSGGLTAPRRYAGASQIPPDQIKPRFNSVL